MALRAVLYRSRLYVAAESSPPLAMDWAVRVVKDLLRGSRYAQDRFDHSSQQRFDDDLDVAATILVNSIFHDVVFEEPGNSVAEFYGWLVQHHPRETTPAAVYNIVRGLRQHEPETFKAVVQKIRPEVLSMLHTSSQRTAVINKCREKDKDDRPAAEQKWCLYTSDGKELKGRHPSEEAAKAQERAIHSRSGSVERIRYRGAQYRLVSGQEAEELVKSIVKEKRTPKKAPVAPGPKMFTREQTTAMWLYGLDKAIDKMYSLMVDAKGNKLCADSSKAEAIQKNIDIYMTSLLKAYEQFKK